MIMVRSLAVLLVVIAAYSSGAVLSARTKSTPSSSTCSPGLRDVAVIFLCWMGAVFRLFSSLGAVATVALWSVAGLVMAFILQRLRAWTMENTAEIPVTGLLKSERSLRAGLRPFLRDVGGFQSRVVLTALYFLVVAPFGIFLGHLRDPLNVKLSPGDSFWKPKHTTGGGVDDARRQY